MSAPWAKRFYNSTAWKVCRLAFLGSKFWLCERCGQPAVICHHKRYLTRRNINDADITLGFWNLEALCNDCHNKEHRRGRYAKPTREGFAFDEEGNLVRDD